MCAPSRGWGGGGPFEWSLSSPFEKNWLLRWCICCAQHHQLQQLLQQLLQALSHLLADWRSDSVVSKE